MIYWRDVYITYCYSLCVAAMLLCGFFCVLVSSLRAACRHFCCFSAFVLEGMCGCVCVFCQLGVHAMAWISGCVYRCLCCSCANYFYWICVYIVFLQRVYVFPFSSVSLFVKEETKVLEVNAVWTELHRDSEVLIHSARGCFNTIKMNIL